jgi:hypothetical protein
MLFFENNKVSTDIYDVKMFVVNINYNIFIPFRLHLLYRSHSHTLQSIEKFNYKILLLERVKLTKIIYLKTI